MKNKYIPIFVIVSISIGICLISIVFIMGTLDNSGPIAEIEHERNLIFMIGAEVDRIGSRQFGDKDLLGTSSGSLEYLSSKNIFLNENEIKYFKYIDIIKLKDDNGLMVIGDNRSIAYPAFINAAKSAPTKSDINELIIRYKVHMINNRYTIDRPTTLVAYWCE